MNLPEDSRKVPQICEGFLRPELRRWLSQSRALPANTRAWVWSPFITWDPEKQTQIVRLGGGTFTCVHQARPMLFKTKPGVHGEL